MRRSLKMEVGYSCSKGKEELKEEKRLMRDILKMEVRIDIVILRGIRR